MWARGKTTVAKENNTFKIADVKQLTKVLAEVTRGHWLEACRHCQDLEDKFWAADRFQEEVAELIIKFDGDSNESDADDNL